MEIHIPKLPCGRVPSYCPDTTPHAPHDFKPGGVRHQGWHCYGIGTDPDAVEDCPNNRRLDPEDTP
jgi:hypothetical protein